MDKSREEALWYETVLLMLRDGAGALVAAKKADSICGLYRQRFGENAGGNTSTESSQR